MQSWLRPSESQPKKITSAVGLVLLSTSTSATVCVAQLLLNGRTRSSLETIQHPQTLRWIAQLFAIVILLCVLLRVPRPDLFYRGYLIGRERISSLISRCTFSWTPKEFLQADGRPLTLSDVPSVENQVKARTLSEKYARIRGQTRLWIRVIRVNAGSFVLQWIIIALKAVVSFSAQYAFHRLLDRLERLPTTQRVSDQATWLWAASMGASLMLETFVDAWLRWVSEMKLRMSVNALLTSLVFEKATKIRISNKIQDKNIGINSQSKSHSVVNLIGSDT